MPKPTTDQLDKLTKTKKKTKDDEQIAAAAQTRTGTRSVTPSPTPAASAEPAPAARSWLSPVKNDPLPGDTRTRDQRDMEDILGVGATHSYTGDPEDTARQMLAESAAVRNTILSRSGHSSDAYRNNLTSAASRSAGNAGSSPAAQQSIAFDPYNYSPDADLNTQVSVGRDRAGELTIPQFLDYTVRRPVGGAAAGIQNVANDIGFRSYQGLPDMEAEDALQADSANGGTEAMRYYNSLLASMDENERLAFEYAGQADPAALYREHLQQEAAEKHRDDKPGKVADWGDRYRAVTEQRYGDVGGLLGFLGDVGESIGYIAPAIALQRMPLVGPYLSKGYLFGAASGGAAEQALSEGASLNDALNYGTLKGSFAVLEEGIFDGLGGLLGKGATDSILEKTAARLGKSPEGQRVLSFLLRIGGEGAENVLEDLWEPLIKTVYTHEQYTGVADYLSELRLSDILYDFLLGVTMGGIFETRRTRRHDPGDVAEAVVVDDALEAFRASPSADTIQAWAQEGTANSLDMEFEAPYNESTPLYRRTVEDGPFFRPISDQLFSQLTAGARAQGAEVIRGGEYAEARLKDGRRAVTLGDLLVFGEDVCKSDIHEELRHLWQNRTGFSMDITDVYERDLRREIDAKEYLISNARKLGIPRRETFETRRELEFYQNALETYLETGEELI